MADLTFNDLLSKDTSALLRTIRQTPAPRPRVYQPPPLAIEGDQFVDDEATFFGDPGEHLRRETRVYMDTPSGLLERAGEPPDDPNAEEPLRKRGSEMRERDFVIGGAHDSLERDYAVTLDMGQEVRHVQFPGERIDGYVNQQDDDALEIVQMQSAATSVLPVIPIATPPAPAVRHGQGRVYASGGNADFDGIASEVYVGLLLRDHAGKVWTVQSVSERSNQATLQDDQLFKTRVSLHRLLGRAAPPCAFKAGERVRYFDKQSSQPIETEILDINETARTAWLLVNGKKRSIRLSQLEGVAPAAAEEL